MDNNMVDKYVKCADRCKKKFKLVRLAFKLHFSKMNALSLNKSS